MRALAAGSDSPHTLVGHPDEADAILITDVFFDHRFWRILANPLVWRNLNRTYLYCEKAIAYRILPGLFTSMPVRKRDLGRYRAAMYTSHNQRLCNAFLEQTFQDSVSPDLLFSYMGRRSNPIRQGILRTFSGATHCHLEDTSGYHHWDTAADNRNDFQARYARVMSRSHFVLCPRGWSPTTIRIFETMQMGRVPVILADDWRRPLGPDWNSFAVFWPERKLDALPANLAGIQAEAPAMGKRARQAWEEHFAPAREWATLAKALHDLHDCRKVDERLLTPLWPMMLLISTIHYGGYRLGLNFRNGLRQGKPST